MRVLGVCFLIAASVGFFKALQKRVSWQETIAATGLAGAGGMVVGALCVHVLGPDMWYLTSAVVGIAGYLGGNTVLGWISAKAIEAAERRIGAPPADKSQSRP